MIHYCNTCTICIVNKQTRPHTYTHTEIERRNISPDIADLGRQNSIVRSSGLSGADRSAANRARRWASTRGHVRHDTDEITNEG